MSVQNVFLMGDESGDLENNRTISRLIELGESYTNASTMAPILRAWDLGPEDREKARKTTDLFRRIALGEIPPGNHEAISQLAFGTHLMMEIDKLVPKYQPRLIIEEHEPDHVTRFEEASRRFDEYIVATQNALESEGLGPKAISLCRKALDTESNNFREREREVVSYIIKLVQQALDMQQKTRLAVRFGDRHRGMVPAIKTAFSAEPATRFKAGILYDYRRPIPLLPTEILIDKMVQNPDFIPTDQDIRLTLSQQIELASLAALEIFLR